MVAEAASGSPRENTRKSAGSRGKQDASLMTAAVSKKDRKLSFVSDAVKKLTSGTQTPVTTVPIGLGDFGLAKVLQE